MFASDPVRGPVVFSSLLLAYLLPGLAAIVLARIARGVRPAWYVNGISALAVLLVFGYVTLEVRHAFQGERLLDRAEHRRARGVVVLGRVAGARPGVSVLRPVARIDGGPAGLGRAGGPVGVQGVPLRPHRHRRLLARISVICLGAVLIGIGLVYQKFVFVRPGFGAVMRGQTLRA